ncbi:MAG: hypothetical protein ACJ78Q_07530 [Chloroflexia bacterium]
MRIPVTDEMLAELVGEELQSRIAMGTGFTAYDITRSLRLDQPHLHIPHDAVRAWVHRYMANVVSGGLYTASQKPFGAQPAVVYEPASLATHYPSIPFSMN